jgi:hypothetical protein
MTNLFRSTFDDGLDPIEQDHPYIYHYTSRQGLEGIVDSGQIRATNIHHLNDAAELIWYANSRFEYVLSNYASKKALERGYAWSGTNNRIITDIVLNHFQRQKTFYTASFCFPHQVNDTDGLLSQWRGYGGNGGYALVFNTKKLHKLIQEEEQKVPDRYCHVNTHRVTYPKLDEFKKATCDLPSPLEKEAIENLLDAYFEELKISGNSDNLWHLSLSQLSLLSSTTKHIGFQEEDEVRVVCDINDEAIETKPIEFYDNGVPYISLFEKGQRLPIEKIIVGPHKEKEQRASELDVYLKKMGIDAKVNVSSIPYISPAPK